MKKISILIVILFSLSCYVTQAQSSDTLRGRNLYRPSSSKSIDKETPYTNTNTSIDMNHVSHSTPSPDVAEEETNSDSVLARQLFVKDSLEQREAFVQDSIQQRMAFIQDSIQKRMRRIDSLNFLVEKLPVLLEASIKTTSDFIIIKNTPLKREEDTALSDMQFEFLPFNLDKPYTPWLNNFNFKDGSVKIKVDTIAQQITALNTPHFKYTYEYAPHLLIIKGQERVLKKRTGALYKVPIDSVFLDNRGRIAKIKKYAHFYQLVNNKKGSSFFIYLDEVKQYTYAENNAISEMEVVKFVDRWRPFDPEKVSSIFNYTIEKGANKYLVRRNQRPINNFADGVFSYSYHANGVLESISFNNNKNTENWKTIIETNNQGNATRYLYQSNGAVSRTILIEYNNNPKAKHKVETITCNFDKDGISYYQYNNTTHKARTRHRMTLEWSDWK